MLNLSKWIATQFLNIRFPVVKHLLCRFVYIVERQRPQCAVEDIKDHVVNIVIFKCVEVVREYQ